MPWRKPVQHLRWTVTGMWIVVIAMLAYQFHDTSTERRQQCRSSIEVREANERSDALLVDDIAQAVVEVTGADVPTDTLEAIKGRVTDRISERYDRLPPPAAC